MYQKILVALDGSETSERALDAALQLAHDAGAQLQPLFVVDVPVIAYDVPSYDPSYIRDALLEEGTHVIDDAANCIQRAANDFKADLVVMGTHGRRGVQRLVLGSVAERFLRIAECAVLMISAHCTQTAASVKQSASEAVKEPS